MNSQCFQRRFNIGKFEEYGLVRDLFIVQQKADAPHYRREANVLGAGQVVQHNLWVRLGCHICLLFTGEKKVVECELQSDECPVLLGPLMVEDGAFFHESRLRIFHAPHKPNIRFVRGNAANDNAGKTCCIC